MTELTPFDPTVPSGKRDTTDLLPRIYRTDANKKFFNSTLSQLTQPGTVKKIVAFIGRQYSKVTQPNDLFLHAPDHTRQNYQLEPSAIIKDKHDNVTFYKDYIDHINHIDILGGNVSNHERLNRQESYSWEPHICLDKFVNYQNYYWQPHGPSTITVMGQQRSIESSYNVGITKDGFAFALNATVINPDITLYRGQTYTFNLDTKNDPFVIKTSRAYGDETIYSKGLSDNYKSTGSITFTVDKTTPDVLYYVSGADPNIGGIFKIFDIDENTTLNVQEDIIGKSHYIMQNGIALSNGMKLQFKGNIFPEIYSTGSWYVEGVGSHITLVHDNALAITGSYISEVTSQFDNDPFDSTPFGSSAPVPVHHEYITINRSSPDRNQWSKSNRWFHKDVLEISETINGGTFSLDQSYRAIRPIIEFHSGLQLFNFGNSCKDDVDLIDTTTRDIFSKIEGSSRYYVDQILLTDGMRVLFTADTDIRANNKIYQVKFVNINKQGKIITFNGADISTNDSAILFGYSHGLVDGNQVTFLDNGNPSITGLVNRNVYYAKVISETSIQLFTDENLNTMVALDQVGVGIYKLELFAGLRRQITLVETADSIPMENETVFVKDGVHNQGRAYWFNGTNWILGQQKISTNQAPLFDVFDQYGNSFSSQTVYPKNAFLGTKIFSYKEGTGANDSALGFPLSYRNINNIGDISFNFNLLSDTFSYTVSDVIYKKSINTGYLKNKSTYVNGWVKTITDHYQPVVRVYKNSNLTNNFPVDVYDTFTKLTVKPYINGTLTRAYSLLCDLTINAKIKNRITDITPSSITTIKVMYDNVVLYDKSYNFNSSNNIFNNIKVEQLVHRLEDLDQKLKITILVDNVEVESVSDYIINMVDVRFDSDVSTNDIITLKCFSPIPKNSNVVGFYQIPVNLQNNPLNNDVTEFTLGQVIDHVHSIVDNLPESSLGLRDHANISAYGIKVVQHTGPLNFSLYHLGSKSANVIEALLRAREDYRVFKLSFLLAISTSGIHSADRTHVDTVLTGLFKDKPKTSPYYLSDMFAYTTYNTIEIEVVDATMTLYPLSKHFDLSTLSHQSVLVYLNGEQLLHGTDYQFGEYDFINISKELSVGDSIEIHEYDSTDGTFCPATPTKLGLYPKFEPKLYLDTSLVTPVNVIQGHDGSIIAAFDDYRDSLILELEKRIFNNIKIEYDPALFDIYNVIPGYNRQLDYTKNEIDTAMSSAFYQWKNNINQDFSKNIGYNVNNPFTYNYRGAMAPNGTQLPAYWRGIYKWMLDTDRPHLCPWEMLGFSIEPAWWQETYGPAPYTNGNLLLWDDISKGIIRDGTNNVNKKFIRPFIDINNIATIPVSENGVLLDPLSTNMIVGYTGMSDPDTFVFGDMGPVETAWRRSSSYPFVVIHAAILLHPNQVLGTCLDRSRIIKNQCDQFVYSDTGLRLRLADIKLPSTVSSKNRIYASGLINYITDYVSGEVSNQLEQYQSDLINLTNVIGSKLGGFTSKEKYNILLDSKSPASSSGIFIPDENYNISLNTSSVIRKVEYSGVIITKVAEGYEVSGYNINNPFFKYLSFGGTLRVIRVGGISENYSEWKPNIYYIAGKVVKVNNSYYRVKTTHTSGASFDNAFYSRLPELPMMGGVEASIRKNWDYNSYNVISYGTILNTIQDVADFIQGYGQYLINEGFIFDYTAENSSIIRNWDSALNEFLFWSTQHWTENATLSISPAANRLKLATNMAIVNDIFDPFYKYQIYQEDGKKLEDGYVTSYREENIFGMSPKNTTHGIYGATLYLIQKEHVLTLDNVTVFNDMIYDTTFGYKQDRVKVIGYISEKWNGGFNIPGFVYDDAAIVDWKQWTDYHIGDIVKYKEFYYSAKEFTTGSASFIPDQWVMLSDKPTPRMLPNWDYRANQFADFYDLESDNFDAQQQKMAQHLIGYQKREYLANIINDDVSQYKFYQGMILEKGTSNVLHKLFDVLSEDGMDSVTFNEEWAVRVGQYGATEIFNELEFQLDESQFKLSPQPLYLGVSNAPNVIDLNPVIKPSTYNPAEFWDASLATVPFLRSCGYVRYSDVDYAIDNLDQLGSIFQYEPNEYIWCGFEGTDGKEWNVYRIVGHTELTTIANIALDTNHDSTIDILDVQTTDITDVARIYPSTPNKIHIVIEGWSELQTLLASSSIKIGLRNNTVGEFFNYVSGIHLSYTGVPYITLESSIFGASTTNTKFTLFYFKSCRDKSETGTELTNETLKWVDKYHAVSGWIGWATIKNNTPIHQETDIPDNNQIKKAFVYDSTSIEYLDVVDVPHGKLPGIADQELKFKTYYDPATYTNTDFSISANVDEGLSWNDSHVGELWWDLTRAKFIDNRGDDILYRSATWNQLFSTASIDIYEWVESTYLPSEWDTYSATDYGYSLGITGTTKYGDALYSVSRKYDKVAQTYVNLYYYWVKNKSTIPNSKGRRLPATSVASLLTSPLNYGYKCLSLIGRNSFVLCNTKGENLNIETWISKKRDANIHSEWKLISDNERTIIPTKIEQKWIDSLIGIDYNNNVLPDYALPMKLRYGIENKPRQGMFINRIEALKLFITHTNTVLKSQLIVDNYNMTGLYSQDIQPNLVSKLWDHSIESDYDLRYIGTANVKTAQLLPIITDGKITNISIVERGYGYIHEPLVTIAGAGTGAKISLTLAIDGSIESATIVEQGYGYLQNTTTLTVRPFSVLVVNDSNNNGKWTVYSWDKLSSSWIISSQQSYDTSQYWDYIDWYSEGYNQFTKIHDVVDSTAQLFIKSIDVGSIVKVKNVSTGGWILAKKIGDNSDTDYLQNFDVIGRQNGTIQLSEKLYSYDNTIFVATSNNPDPYATHVSDELRNIIYSIRDDIFIGELRHEYLYLFFSGVRYVMSEQPMVDWIFKTSYIKAIHNVGALKQKVTYNNDNLQHFEDYVNEVKPYRTKVREYISTYNNLENSSTFISDFDLPSVIDSSKNYNAIYNQLDDNGILHADQQYVNSYPWKSWNDNIGYAITDIMIVDGGEGYIVPPTITFENSTGSGAVATAFIQNGKVNRIKVVSGGFGYLTSPNIKFNNGLAYKGTPARATAILGDSLVRSSIISMKYDRITPKYEIADLFYQETFTGTKGKLQYPLHWSVQLDKLSTTVFINGIEVLDDQYSIFNTSKKIGGFTVQYGVLSFVTSPSATDTIKISYKKDIRHLMATDRIKFYYSPAHGEDIAQLMIGVDYAGAIVTGAALKISEGWDSVEWDNDLWDSFEPSFDTYNAIVDIGTPSITLPYIPALNEKLNIYIDGVRIDGVKIVDKNSDGTYRFVENYMPNYYGDGVNNVIDIPHDAYEVIQNKQLQVVEKYIDNNISIVSKNIIVADSNVIDVIDTSVYKSVRYQVQCILDGTYTFDMLLTYNPTEVKLFIEDGVLPMAHFNYGLDSNDNIVLTIEANDPVNASISGMSILMVKWMFTHGGNHDVIAELDGVNDSNFIISSEAFNTFEANFTEVLDEFSINQFNSGCYYVQLTDGLSVQCCELEVLHNGDVAKLMIIGNDTIGDPDGCATFTAEIINDLVTIKLTPKYENLMVVYSRVLLTGLTANPTTINSIRRVSNGEFALSTFDMEVTGTDTTIIDSFNTFRCSAVKYQIQMLSGNKCHIIDMNASLDVDNNLNILSSSYIGGLCGSFSSEVVNGIFNLKFTSATTKKVYINGFKTMMGNSYTAFVPVLYTPHMKYDILSVKTSSDMEIVLDSFDLPFKTARYEMQINNIFGYHSCEILVMVTDGAVEITQYSELVTDGIIGIFTAELDNQTVKLKFAPVHSNTGMVILRTLISPTVHDLSIKIISDSTHYINTKTATLTGTNDVVISSFDYATVSSIKYFMMITDGTTSQTLQILVTTNELEVDLVEYSILGDTLAIFTAEISNGQINLIAAGNNTALDLIWVEEPISKNKQLAILPDSVMSLYTRNIAMNTISLNIPVINPTIIDVIYAADYTNGYYQIQAKSGTTINVVQLNFMHTGVAVDSTIYSILDIGGDCGSFECNFINNAVQIVFTPTIADVTLTITKTLINANLSTVSLSNGLIIFDDFGKKATISVIKEVSDASANGQPFEFETGTGLIDYDTSISGGSLFQNSTLVGFRPEDLILDGDQLDSTTAPEELLPGYLTDTIAIKVFNKDLLSCYMQFKDLNNHDQYKRLNANKTTTLAKDLLENDTKIVVLDGSVLSQPDSTTPGLIEIGGEQIYYMARQNNVLSQLRRGAYGTSTPVIHRIGMDVITIDKTETIPYHDDYIIDRYISKRTTSTIPLSYVPSKVSNETDGTFIGKIVNGVFVLEFKPTVADTFLSGSAMKISNLRLKTLKQYVIILDSFDIQEYIAVKYEIHAQTLSSYSTYIVNGIYINSSINYTQYSNIVFGDNLGIFRIDYHNGKMQLIFEPTVGDIDIVFNRTVLGTTITSNPVNDFSSNDYQVTSLLTTIPDNTETVIHTFDNTIGSIHYTALVSDGTISNLIELCVIPNEQIIGYGVINSEINQNGMEVIHSLGSFSSNGSVLSFTSTSNNPVMVSLIIEKYAINEQLALLPNSVSSMSNHDMVLNSNTKVINGMGTVIIDYFDASLFTGGDYKIQIISGANIGIFEIHFAHNGIITEHHQYAIAEIGEKCGVLDCQLIGGILNILFTPTVSTSTVTYSRRLINANVRSSMNTYSYGQSNDTDVYIGGDRLRKSGYDMFTGIDYPYSPEGDKSFDADFKVDGIVSHVKLTKPVSKGIEIKVIKKQGKRWDVGSSAETFLKNVPGISPTYLIDKYQYTLLADSNETLTTDGNIVLEID